MGSTPLSPFVWLVLCWLGSWRITMMLAYESGPFELFSWTRVALARVRLGRFASCFHCMGVWISAVMTILVFGLEAQSIPVALAVAGGVSMAERALGGEVEHV